MAFQDSLKGILKVLPVISSHNCDLQYEYVCRNIFLYKKIYYFRNKYFSRSTDVNS